VAFWRPTKKEGFFRASKAGELIAISLSQFYSTLQGVIGILILGKSGKTRGFVVYFMVRKERAVNMWKWLWLVMFLGVLWANPFPGMEVETEEPLSVETEEYARFQEKTHFRGFRWGDDRPSVLQKEDARFVTNIVQDRFLLTFYVDSAQKWISFLRGDVFISYVFENNKLILGYYVLPLETLAVATNTYERIKKHLVGLYSSVGSYSLGFINLPDGDLDNVLAFYRWKTSNTLIELTLEAKKYMFDPRSVRERFFPFVLVLSYTDARQQERVMGNVLEHP